MKIRLEFFEDIGEKYAKTLRRKSKIKSVDDFYNFDINFIHKRTKIDIARLETWRKVFDLFHVPKLSVRDAEQLVHIGITSIYDLAHRQPIRILYKLKELDIDSHHIILHMPTIAEIEIWIHYAKSMIKRLKYSLDVPLILFPMVNLDVATELQKYRIWTIEDLDESMIHGLRKRINMNKKIFEDFIHLLDLLHVDGIDLYIANILIKAGIDSVKSLHEISLEELVESVKNVQSKEVEVVEMLTHEVFATIKQNSEEVSENYGGKLYD